MVKSLCDGAEHVFLANNLDDRQVQYASQVIRSGKTGQNAVNPSESKGHFTHHEVQNLNIVN